MNFNDGTFSWYQEGYFQAWEYPLNIESSGKEPLRLLLAGRQQLYLVYDDQPGIMAFCTVGSHNRGWYAFVDGGVNNPQTQIPDRREPV